MGACAAWWMNRVTCLPFAVDQKSCVSYLKQRVAVWLTMKTIAGMPKELVCCSCSVACGWPSWINNGDTKYKHADDTLPFCNNRILYNPSIGPSDIQSVSNMWVKNTLSKSGGLNKWGAKMASSGISYKQSVLTYNHRHYNYDLGTKHQWQNAIAQNPSTKNACPNP